MILCVFYSDATIFSTIFAELAAAVFKNSSKLMSAFSSAESDIARITTKGVFNWWQACAIVLPAMKLFQKD